MILLLANAVGFATKLSTIIKFWSIFRVFIMKHNDLFLCLKKKNKIYMIDYPKDYSQEFKKSKPKSCN